MLIKVCCIQDVEEAHVAAEAGATHVGLVGPMPSGPGPLPDDEISEIAAAVPQDVVPVLLTSRVDAAGIVDHVRDTGVRAVQIVDWVDAEVRHEVRRVLPEVELLQVVHVEARDSVADARAASVGSDYVLLDSGRPTADIPELGGTGRTHDWALSAEIVSLLDVPVFLAGGLNPANVAAAIRAVRPAGVDLCSGIRNADGRLEADRLRDFVSAVRRI